MKLDGGPEVVDEVLTHRCVIKIRRSNDVILDNSHYTMHVCVIARACVVYRTDLAELIQLTPGAVEG